MKNATLLIWAAIMELVVIAPVPAIGPIFGPPRIQDYVVFYDTEGNSGMVPASIDGHPGVQPTIYADIGGSGDLFIGGVYSAPLVSFEGLTVGLVMGEQGVPFYDPGTPYYIRRYHPDFGCFSTFGYVGAQFQGSWPMVVIPIPFSEYGIPNRVVDNEDPGAEALSIQMFNASICDDPTTMSLGVQATKLFGSLLEEERPKSSVRIDFLPGNTQSGTINWRPNQYVEYFHLHWGEPLPGEPDPSRLELGTPAPEGPVLVSFSFDGYTTDTITLNVEKGKAYWWYPVLKSITGPTPTGYNPNGGILDQGIADALLGECNPSATLRTAWDPNQDGKTDAADFTTPDSEP